MAIYRLLQKSVFEPEDSLRMQTAYEFALARLALQDRSDPITEMVARYIIEAAQTGEKDPHTICAIALSSLNGTDHEAS